jgi:hypothetical protein
LNPLSWYTITRWEGKALILESNVSSSCKSRLQRASFIPEVSSPDHRVPPVLVAMDDGATLLVVPAVMLTLYNLLADLKRIGTLSLARALEL